MPLPTHVPAFSIPTKTVPESDRAASAQAIAAATAPADDAAVLTDKEELILIKAARVEHGNNMADPTDLTGYGEMMGLATSVDSPGTEVEPELQAKLDRQEADDEKQSRARADTGNNLYYAMAEKVAVMDDALAAFEDEEGANSDEEGSRAMTPGSRNATPDAPGGKKRTQNQQLAAEEISLLKREEAVSTHHNLISREISSERLLVIPGERQKYHGPGEQSLLFGTPDAPHVAPALLPRRAAKDRAVALRRGARFRENTPQSSPELDFHQDLSQIACACRSRRTGSA